MRVTTRHRPADPESFVADVHDLLLVLAAAPGFISGELGRSPDEPDVMLLTARWQDAGSMRRGMGSYDAKVALAPVMVSAADDVSVFEVLLEVADGVVRRSQSARAPGDASR